MREKLHRSLDKMTRGITSTLSPNDEKFHNFRFFFYETDMPFNQYHFNRIIALYESHNCDFVCHQTGGGGLHFKSPTLITRKEWKEMMNEVKDINPACPMIALRILPNKYCDESSVWNKASVGYNGEIAEMFNSEELCFLLNKWFGSKFKGQQKTILRLIDYPLPCPFCNKAFKKGVKHGKNICVKLWQKPTYKL